MRITKIYDYDCPICAHMATFEGNVIFNLTSRVHFEATPLESIRNPEDAWEETLKRYTEVYVCNPDYSLDLPVYLVTEGKRYVGHVNGEQTAVNLKTKLESIIRGAPNKEGDSTVDS